MAIGGGDGSSKANAITVETLEDLISANTTYYQKYIKVINDINPINESWYTGSISPIGINNHIYSDDHYKIEGITIRGTWFIAATTTSTEGTLECGFHNLNLCNWCFRDTYSGGSDNWLHLFAGTGGANWIYFRNCEHSVKIVQANKTRIIPLCAKLALYDTSLYFQFTNNGDVGCLIEGATSSSYCWMERTNVVIDGANVTFRFSGSDSHIDVASIVCVNCHAVSYNNAFINNTWMNSIYFAFLNCTFGTIPALYATRITPVACDQSGIFTTSSQYIVLATTVDSTDPDFNTSSIKSKQFLIDCGFLP